MIGAHVKPGVSTEEIDRLCHDHIVDVQGAIPANVGYQRLPKTVCTSVNQVVCHGIPSAAEDPEEGRHRQHRRGRHQGRLVRRLQPHVLRGRAERAGAPAGRHHLRGHARRHPAGAPGRHAGRRGPCHPVGGAPRALQRGARVLRPRHRAGLPRRPQVLHYGQPGQGLRLEAGMVFTIEPMVNAGRRETRELPDGWTVVTRDHSLSGAVGAHGRGHAHEGFELLTPWPEGTGHYPAICVPLRMGSANASSANADRRYFDAASVHDAARGSSGAFGMGTQATGRSPPRMSPGLRATAPSCFVAGSTRRPVHLGTLLANGRSTTALKARADAVPLFAK
jgi:methionyl aminopeptidase